ncbi:MAG: peptidoglycan-binding domain-containing protein [Solirubrobacterales bacterium]
MNRSFLPLAIAGIVAVTPALAQQSVRSSTADTLTTYRGEQLSLAPVQDVLAAAEQRLNQMGYHVQGRGHFDDPDLRNSVLLFQSDHGLRPTGNIDLSTLAALGIDVDPVGRSTAMVEPRRETAAVPVRQETLQQALAAQVDLPMLRTDSSMSSPQTAQDVRDFENLTGVPQPPSVIRNHQLGAIPDDGPTYRHRWD